MFAGLMKESLMSNVRLFDVKPKVMETLINFCYTSFTDITENNAIDLLKAADLFQVSKLVIIINRKVKEKMRYMEEFSWHLEKRKMLFWRYPANF